MGGKELPGGHLVNVSRESEPQPNPAGTENPPCTPRAWAGSEETISCGVGRGQEGKPLSRGGSGGTYDPRASMKMKVFRMLLVCFFQDPLSSSSLRPISSRVAAGSTARKRRRRQVT